LVLAYVKVPRPGVRERTFRFSSQATTCYYQSNHSNVETIPFSALTKDTTSEQFAAYLHTIPLMLNVKQGSCKYHVLSLLV